jgi:hypothetical protein
LGKLMTKIRCQNPFCPSCIPNAIPDVNWCKLHLTTVLPIVLCLVFSVLFFLFIYSEHLDVWYLWYM